MTEIHGAADRTARELPLAAGGELELRLSSNRLRLRTTAGDRVVIRGRTDHDLERDVEITSGDGWVRVADGPAGSFRMGPITVRNGGHAPDLDVEVPRNVRISARTLSGDIEAVGIVGPSRWQSASGDVRIGSEGGAVTIETMSGDALVDARAPLALTCRTVSGSVKVHAPAVQSLDVATTSGDVTIEAPLEEGGTHSVVSVSGDVRLITSSEVTVELQTITGDIKASMPHRAEGGRSRRTVVVGSGRVRVGVKTMSGDVRIRQGSADPADLGSQPGGGDMPGSDARVRGSFWADFGRDWAESAKDWAQWGASWAAGKAWASPSTAPASTSADSAPAASAPAANAPAPTAEAPVEAAVDPAPVEAPGPATAASLDDTAPVPEAGPADLEAARLSILRQLERGELDVETAAGRLAALDGIAAR